VTVTVNSRVVVVKGPRGTLTRSFKHLNFDMAVVGGKQRKFVVSVFFASKRQLAAVRTVTSHIQNLITGVTKVNSTSFGTLPQQF
jgi:large subunit ribosomal protein L9e